MGRGLSTHNSSLNLRPVSIGGGQSIPYLRRVLSYPRPSRPPVRLKSVFGYSCCQYGSSKTPHYSYDVFQVCIVRSESAPAKKCLPLRSLSRYQRNVIRKANGQRLDFRGTSFECSSHCSMQDGTIELVYFFFKDTAKTEIYTLSLHPHP